MGESGLVRNDAKGSSEMEGSVMGSKRLTPTRVGKMASKCLLLLLYNCCVSLCGSIIIMLSN